MDTVMRDTVAGNYQNIRASAAAALAKEWNTALGPYLTKLASGDEVVLTITLAGRVTNLDYEQNATWKAVRKDAGEKGQPSSTHLELHDPRQGSLFRADVGHVSAAAAAVVDAADGVDAAETMVRSAGRCTVTLLQRQLKVSYPRAAALCEELEALGVVGPADAEGVRPVLERDEAEAAVNGGAGLDRGTSEAVQDHRD